MNDNTKQPPQELVEKLMNLVLPRKGEGTMSLSNKAAEQCAQIAVDYAEEENMKVNIREKHLVHTLWQIIRCIEAKNDQLNYHLEQAKQLLNK